MGGRRRRRCRRRAEQDVLLGLHPRLRLTPDDDRLREELTGFLAVHGSLSVHDWLDPTASDEDAYSLFIRRSVALGWSDSAVSSPPQGRTWTVVDAGQDWTGATRGACAGGR